MWDLFQECKFGLIIGYSLIQCINRSKETSHIIIFRDAEKTFDKIYYPFMNKTLKKRVIYVTEVLSQITGAKIV